MVTGEDAPSSFGWSILPKEYNFTERGFRVIKDDIEYVQFRIAEEERLALQSPFPEAGLGHSQMAMLYRSQLTALYRSLEVYEQAA